MSEKKDYLRSEITSQLAPMLLEAGFQRYKPKQFIRVRGDLVDSIAIQMSQWGGKDFFVHRHTNFICDPTFCIQSYAVGERFSSGADGGQWVADSEVAAYRAVASVVFDLRLNMLPWFDSIKNLSEYFVAYIANPMKELETLEVAAIFLALGKTNRPYWIASNGIEKIQEEPDSFEDPEARIAEYATIMDAIDAERTKELLASWRRKNILDAKLEKYFDIEYVGE